MASAGEIQGHVNAITGCLNELADVDWNAYTVEGPGMNNAMELARGMTAQAGMLITIASAIMEPVQVFAAAIEEGMTQ